ncbi:MAG: 4-oxalomesaconate tautomerase [Rhodobacteraceae bacterium]|nr:4-oxalomesaconate tautomerase [Paracoccaceae bacterium]
MTQTPIPYVFMRGGTSRGPYMQRKDLPRDQETLARVLVSMIGSGHGLNIDGIGGGNAVTTKVAMLSRSDDAWADVDYLFAQVGVKNGLVDFKPSCGNILAGVGPAAIEMGLIDPADTRTEVRIRAVNTGARTCATVRTAAGSVVYDGDASIDGVPGTAAPIELMFRDIAGGSTGAMFPTGNRINTIDGIAVTCIDVAMPMAIACAGNLDLTGYETAAQLDENRAFFDRMEAVRIKAGALMGMGDVSQSVTPKFGILAPARDGGTAAVRYFMPWNTHPGLAVTGAQAMGACLLCPGTVGAGLTSGKIASPARLLLEHPMGQLKVTLEYRQSGHTFEVISAGLERTARKLASGEVFVPKSVWNG